MFLGFQLRTLLQRVASATTSGASPNLLSTILTLNSFFDILGLFYDGPVYPRYLYSYSLGFYVTGMFPSYRPIETLTIWYDQNTMVQYRGVLNAETDTTVINGNYVDFENRNTYIGIFKIRNTILHTYIHKILYKQQYIYILY